MQCISTHYLAKLEFTNQTRIFQKIFTDLLKNLFVLYEKNKKSRKTAFITDVTSDIASTIHILPALQIFCYKLPIAEKIK